MCNSILDISGTLKIVSDCWEKAEGRLQTAITRNCPDSNEEFITKRFHEMFNEQLEEANKTNRIAQAFLNDLGSAFPDLPNRVIQQYDGLIAEVILHRRSTEAVTGGDIGIVINRPQIAVGYDGLELSDYRQGLLCQAKLRTRKGNWGKLTSNQKKVLQQKLKFLGLLLYSYRDGDRRLLNKFEWQLCSTASSISEVNQWLEGKTPFPSPARTPNIIRGIGNGEIGTDDKNLLDTIIAPSGNSVLELTIKWPKDPPPSHLFEYEYEYEYEDATANNRVHTRQQ